MVDRDALAFHPRPKRQFSFPVLKRIPLLLHYLAIGTLEPRDSLLRRDRSPSLRTLGRVLAHPDHAKARPSLPDRRACFTGGFVATQVSTMTESANRPSPLLAEDCAHPWLPAATSRDPRNQSAHSAAHSYNVSAHTVQFVASPGKTQKLQSLLPVAIREALRFNSGFAGCMVMISDQEARLVTVVTLWTGEQRTRHCSENVDRVKKILSPYIDNLLRSENHLAHFSMLSPLERNLQECCSSGIRSTLNP